MIFNVKRTSHQNSKNNNFPKINKIEVNSLEEILEYAKEESDLKDFYAGQILLSYNKKKQEFILEFYDDWRE